MAGKGVWGALLSQVRKICTALAMALLFFVVVTPVGLMMRMVGRDRLRLRFELQQPTYWVPRASHGARQTLMTKQF